MQTLSFETLIFQDAGEQVKVILLKLYEALIPKCELDMIGKCTVATHEISFDTDNPKATVKFYKLLAQAFQDLQGRISKKQTIYIHRGSGIPLIGNIAFGITDRGTNIVEVKPMTGCNIKCTYCSVNEDVRLLDFVVEKDYLVEEFAKVVSRKDCDDIEVHVGPQGEPLLYGDLVELIRDLRRIPQVKRVSMVTNGTLLTTQMIDALIDAGLTRIDLSINAMTPDVAKKIADVGDAYNIEKVKKIAQYMADKVELVITPTWIPGVNDDQLGAIVEFTKSLQNDKRKPTLGIQNFLNYRFGRNPVKEAGWDNFYELLKQLEQKHGFQLILDARDFKVQDTKTLAKPFKKDDVVDVDVVCKGRLPGEWIGVASDRNLSVYHCDGPGQHRVKITRSKHNIFTAVCV